MFWYEYLDNPEGSNIYEKKFGLRPSLATEKPAWKTLQVLIKMRPPSSTVINASGWRGADETTFHSKWRRPDGDVGWGLWTTTTDRSYTFAPGGAIIGCFDQYGESKRYVTNNDGSMTVTIGPEITYVIASR